MENGTNISIVILASGFSRRYGRNKLLERLGNSTVLGMTVKNALSSIATGVYVVIEPGNEQIVEIIPDQAHVVENPERSKGISSAVKRGIETAGAVSEGILFLVADQPFFSSDSISDMIGIFFRKKCGIVACSFHGEIRNPMVFRRKYYHELAGMEGDQGARTVALKHREDICIMEVDRESLMDIDRPEDISEALKITSRRKDPELS